MRICTTRSTPSLLAAGLAVSNDSAPRAAAHKQRRAPAPPLGDHRLAAAIATAIANAIAAEGIGIAQRTGAAHVNLAGSRLPRPRRAQLMLILRAELFTDAGAVMAGRAHRHTHRRTHRHRWREGMAGGLRFRLPPRAQGGVRRSRPAQAWRARPWCARSALAGSALAVSALAVSALVVSALAGSALSAAESGAGEATAPLRAYGGPQAPCFVGGWGASRPFVDSRRL